MNQRYILNLNSSSTGCRVFQPHSCCSMCSRPDSGAHIAGTRIRCPSFAAKMYIVSVNEKINYGDGGAIPLPDDDVICSSTPNQQSSFSRAKYVNSKIQAARESSSTSLTGHQDTILSQLNRYLADVCEVHIDDGLAFWARKLPRYNKLSDLGEDLMAASASQAYVERIFSLRGQLTGGRRNRMTKSLEMRAFLKLNAGLCHL